MWNKQPICWYINGRNQLFSPWTHCTCTTCVLWTLSTDFSFCCSLKKRFQKKRAYSTLQNYSSITLLTLSSRERLPTKLWCAYITVKCRYVKRVRCKLTRTYYEYVPRSNLRVQYDSRITIIIKSVHTFNYASVLSSLWKLWVTRVVIIFTAYDTWERNENIIRHNSLLLTVRRLPNVGCHTYRVFGKGFFFFFF